MTRVDLLACIIHAVNARTGDVTHLTVDEYAECERVGLLDGYLVRLGRIPAEACAAEIRARVMNCN